MNFIFISPSFPKTYYQFCKELKKLGVNILGIGDDPYEVLPQELKDSLNEYYKVSNLINYDEVFKGVAYFSYKYGHIDYIESNNEFWLEQDARLRTDFNLVTGKKLDEIIYFKSKEAMKKHYKETKVKVARCIIPTTLEKGGQFIKEVGYPVVVKPDNGVGAEKTYSINNDKELEDFYLKDFPSVKYIMEEYIDGDLISFDGVVNSKSEVIFMSNEVFPDPVMEVNNKQLDFYYYSNIVIPKDLEDAGRRVLKAFEAKSRCFHLEFFRLKTSKKGLGKKGDLIGLEVNMRSPGGYTPDMMNFAHSVSVYEIYAKTIVYDEDKDANNGKKYYCGCYGRRDSKKYKYSTQEVYDRFKDKIVMHEIMPKVLAHTMGDEAFYFKTESFEELNEFRDYLAERID